MHGKSPETSSEPGMREVIEGVMPSRKGSVGFSPSFFLLGGGGGGHREDSQSDLVLHQLKPDASEACEVLR